MSKGKKSTAVLPWYDATWLRQYHDARKILSAFSQEALNDFDKKTRPLRTSQDFESSLVESVLCQKELGQVRDLIDSLSESAFEHHELINFGRIVLRNHSCILPIHKRLSRYVSDKVGEEVIPTYNFLSLYNNLGKCDIHLDAPIAKWTLDICIDQSEVWPFYISNCRPWPSLDQFVSGDFQGNPDLDSSLKFRQFSLKENQAILFSGSSQWHYRERISRQKKSNFCNVLFLHYAPASCEELLRPAAWAEIMNIKELRELNYSPEILEI